MKNAKLSLFGLALTLSVGVSSGVYACERNKDTKGVKPTCVAQKVKLKDEKTHQCDAKSVKNYEDKKNEDKKNCNKNHKDFKKKNENKCHEMKPVISEADKAALKVKKDKIATVKDANKVLKAEIIKNTEAVKVELKRIEDSKIVLDPLVKAEADSVLLAVKDATTKKAGVKPVTVPVEPVSVIEAPVVPLVDATLPIAPVVDATAPVVSVVDTTVPVVPVIEPTVPVVPVIEPTVPVVPIVNPTVPVEKTYLERLNERLDNALQQYIEKNTQLTTIGSRILSLLNSLTLIK